MLEAAFERLPRTGKVYRQAGRPIMQIKQPVPILRPCDWGTPGAGVCRCISEHATCLITGSPAEKPGRVH